MTSNIKQNDVGLDCLRTGRVKVAGPFLDSYKHYLNRAWNPMEWYRDITGETPQHVIDDGGWMTTGARAGVGTAAAAIAALTAPHVAGAVGAKGTAATLANTLNASRSAAPLVNAVSHIPGAVRTGKALQPVGKAINFVGKPIVKTLSNAAKYTKHMMPSDPAWQTALKLAPPTLTGKLIGGGKAIGKTMVETGMLGGAGKALQGLDDPNNTNSVAQNFAEGFAPSTLRGIPAHIGNKLVPRIGYILGYVAPEIASAIVNPSNKELQSKINNINLQMDQGALPFEDGLRQLVDLGAITQEDAEAYIREQGNTPQQTTPDLNLPPQLQTNPNAALLQHYYFNTPKPVQFDLSDKTVTDNILKINDARTGRGVAGFWTRRVTGTKVDIPEKIVPLFEQSVEAIKQGKPAVAFNLSLYQLQEMNAELAKYTAKPAFQQQSPGIQATVKNIQNQVAQQAQQLQEGFANIDPAAPEYQLDKILPSFVLDETELTQMQPKLEQMDTLYQQLAAQGLDETQIQQQIKSQIPDADNIATRAGLHELASSQLQNMQNGIDSADQLEAINAIVAGSEAADLSKPGPTNAIREGFEKATNTSIFSAKGWNEAFEWFSNLEGIEKVAVLGGIGLGLAGLITGIFGDNFLLSLIMMTLGAGAVAYGVPEARGQIGEWINQLMPKEEAKK